jgi:hypothetical protein
LLARGHRAVYRVYGEEDYLGALGEDDRAMGGDDGPDAHQAGGMPVTPEGPEPSERRRAPEDPAFAGDRVLAASRALADGHRLAPRRHSRARSLAVMLLACGGGLVVGFVAIQALRHFGGVSASRPQSPTSARGDAAASVERRPWSAAQAKLAWTGQRRAPAGGRRMGAPAGQRASRSADAAGGQVRGGRAAPLRSGAPAAARASGAPEAVVVPALVTPATPIVPALPETPAAPAVGGAEARGPGGTGLEFGFER